MRCRASVCNLLMAGCLLLGGCRLIGFCVYTVAATVGLAGYAVYKTGDAAVTGVGKAGKAVASGSTSAATVAFADGELRTRYAGDVKTVWEGARRAVQKAGFYDIRGTCDALSGEVLATTPEREEIAIRLRAAGADATEARIRVGSKGDMKAAEVVSSLVLGALSAGTPAAPAGATSATAGEGTR